MDSSSDSETDSDIDTDTEEDDDDDDDDDDEEEYAITSYASYDTDYEAAMYDALNETSSLFFDAFMDIQEDDQQEYIKAIEAGFNTDDYLDEVVDVADDVQYYTYGVEAMIVDALDETFYDFGEDEDLDPNE
jgi:hypothetical protein